MSFKWFWAMFSNYAIICLMLIIGNWFQIPWLLELLVWFKKSDIGSIVGTIGLVYIASSIMIGHTLMFGIEGAIANATAGVVMLFFGGVSHLYGIGWAIVAGAVAGLSILNVLIGVFGDENGVCSIMMALLFVAGIVGFCIRNQTPPIIVPKQTADDIYKEEYGEKEILWSVSFKYKQGDYYGEDNYQINSTFDKLKEVMEYKKMMYEVNTQMVYYSEYIPKNVQ